MEIKLELDTEKSTKAAVAIATVYALSRVSLAMESPNLRIANAITTIHRRDTVLPLPGPQVNRLSSLLRRFT